MTQRQVTRIAPLTPEEKKNLAGHIIVDYPEAKGLSINAAIKYKQVIDTYPDLKELGTVKLRMLAYDFRQEQMRDHLSKHASELADGRCNPQLGPFFTHIPVPGDLPAFSLERECVICFDRKKAISICPDCWRLVRKALDIKGVKGRPGWEHWGLECSLDKSNVVKILKSDKEGEELLRQQIEQEKEK